MATFSNFSDLLPDPNNKINTAGAADATGSAGPGFAKIKFASDNTTQVSRTISGRGVTASPSYHKWNFDITYNELTRADFDPVSSFLESRRGRLNPFYVILPQHAAPKDTNFNTYVSSRLLTITSISATGSAVTLNFATQAATPFPIGTVIYVEGVVPTGYNGIYTATAGTTSSVTFTSTTTGTMTTAGTINGITAAATAAGSTTITIKGPATFSGDPSPGDFFTISDPTDVNHKKTYKVIRVETNSTYRIGDTQPTVTQRRIHTHPPITRTVTVGSGINFINPKFRVTQKGDTLEYDLDTDNLYQFSLSLEETLP